MTQRTPIWTAIAHSLRDDIAAGVYAPDAKLPTEAALAARFGVNRHTVRHAIKALTKEGLVLPRRGAGVYVTSTPTDYPIGRRVRFHQNLTAAGRGAGSVDDRSVAYDDVGLAQLLERLVPGVLMDDRGAVAVELQHRA